MIKVKKSIGLVVGRCNACSSLDADNMVDTYEILILNSTNSGTSVRLCTKHLTELINAARMEGFRESRKHALDNGAEETK